MIALDRFWAKVEPEPMSGCWLWIGASDRRGYGRFWGDGHCKLPHRLAWEMERGPIPAGMDLDHLCRMPPCVNPNHLRIATRQENLLAGEGFPAQEAKRTHCPAGHPYNAENTWLDPLRHSRHCRTCNRVRSRAFRKRYPGRGARALPAA